MATETVNERWQEITDTLTDFRFLERKAAEVGVVTAKDAEDNETRTYTGPYLLQEDYALALERMPGGDGASSGQRQIIVTATDFGQGYVVRCPHCRAPSALLSASAGVACSCRSRSSCSSASGSR